MFSVFKGCKHHILRTSSIVAHIIRYTTYNMAGKRRRSDSDHSDSDSHSESSEEEKKFHPRLIKKKGSIVVESDEENDSDRESGEDSPHSDDVGGVEDLTVRLESIENGIGLKADKEALRRLKKRVEKLEAYVEEIKVKGAPDRRTASMRSSDSSVKERVYQGG